MNERNTQMNFTPDQCASSMADFVYLRSPGYFPSFYSYGYTSWLFTDGRSYRS
jgi:hypothetical protein